MKYYTYFPKIKNMRKCLLPDDRYCYISLIPDRCKSTWYNPKILLVKEKKHRFYVKHKKK